MILSSVAPTQASLLTRSRAATAAIAGILLFLPALRLAAEAPVEPASGNCSSRDLIQTANVGPYLFKAYKNRVKGDGCLEVLESRRSGKIIGRFIPKVVFRSTLDGMGEYRLGQPEDPAHDTPKIENGGDITGRGHADMIVTNWTGGAHCCYVHYVFEVEPALWMLAKIDDGDGDAAHFADLDGNNHYYYIGNDWTFAFWDSSFTASLAPAIVLRFVDGGPQGGAYRLAMDKMQRPAPTPPQWNKAVRESSAFDDGIGSGLTGNMLNLIYTGHSDLAWLLLDQAWPAPRPGKDKYLAGFCAQLKTSPYWPQLQPTILNPPPVCSASAP